MDYVYDFMLHLLKEYAKLLKFEPTIPPNAVELCSEKMACQANGLAREFMRESMVYDYVDTSPCNMPPPYSLTSLTSLLKKKSDSIKEVELWEKKFWENPKKKP